jgi:PAS domain-containing protein
MSYQLINETLLMVDQEINDFLMDFPDDHPFQMALSLPLFRQQLRAKILNKIPNRHRVYCDDLSRIVAADCFLGMLKERLLVEEEIRQMMPTLINEHQHPRPIKAGSQSLAGSRSFQINEMAWWIKIHTIIPCVTYYFGPFETQAEAKHSYPGYVEDLQQEKAIGISVQLQKIQPTFLTVVDSPDDLKRDQKRLWRRIQQLNCQQLAKQKLLQNQWNILPGIFLVVNFDGTIKSANARACQLFNSLESEIKGQSLFLYVPQPQIFFLEEQLEIMVKNEQDWPQPYRWSMQLQVAAIAPILVDIEVTQQKNAQGTVIGWYWLLHQLTPSPQTIDQNQANNCANNRYDGLRRSPNHHLSF